MLLFKGKNKSDIKLEAPVPDFIPYACHFDGSTLLTKNGSLIQIIKIEGFSQETANANDIRDFIRKTIIKHVKNTKLAIWIHTVRRKRSLDSEKKFNGQFMGLVHEVWCHKNYWRDKFVNELYFSIVIDGYNFDSLNFKEIFKTFSFFSQEKKYLSFLKNNYLELNDTVNKCLEELKNYGARKLEIKVDEKGSYSEMLQFISKMIYLKEERNPIPIIDLSEYLSTHKIAFGINAFEVKDDKSKFFGAILTLKEYHDLSPKSVDLVLQLPHQLVVSEAIIFTTKNDAQESYKYQKYIYGISGDERMSKDSFIDGIFNEENTNSTSYCKHQITITVIAEDSENLDLEVARSTKAFNNLGLVVVREDLNLENCFWSQLPGNFKFVVRESKITTNMIGGFASLHNFPVGTLKSKWGDAITIFRTASGSPYFFNFHHNNVGHTLILGPNNSGKATLVNFLLSEADRISPKVLLICSNSTSQLSVKAMEGEYRILDGISEFGFNPLMLEDNEINRVFLENWLKIILDDNELNYSELVIKIYQMPNDLRNLNNLIYSLGENYKKKGIVEKCVRGGKYEKLFNSKENNFFRLSNKNIKALEISLLKNEDTLLLSFIAYIFHEFEKSLDGNPAIIVLNDIFNTLNNEYFTKYLRKWMLSLSEKNAIVIYSFESSNLDLSQHLKDILQEECVTKILLPNQDLKSYKKIIKLNSENETLIKNMQVLNRNFMLMQGKDCVVGELNLAGYEFVLDILSDNSKARNLIETICKEIGSDKINDWLPIYCDRYN